MNLANHKKSTPKLLAAVLLLLTLQCIHLPAVENGFTNYYSSNRHEYT